MSPYMRRLENKMMTTKGLDFTPWVYLANDFKTLLLGDTERRIPSAFVVEVSRLVKAFLDKNAYWVNKLSPAATAVKKGMAPALKPEPGETTDQGWAMDMKDYRHFVCQTSRELAKCQYSCVALFHFLELPKEWHPFPIAQEGRNCIIK